MAQSVEEKNKERGWKQDGKEKKEIFDIKLNEKCLPVIKSAFSHL